MLSLSLWISVFKISVDYQKKKKKKIFVDITVKSWIETCFLKYGALIFILKFGVMIFSFCREKKIKLKFFLFTFCMWDSITLLTFFGTSNFVFSFFDKDNRSIWIQIEKKKYR